ncbi:MAG TPA: DUF192 domain-containing protein [Candidatus Paceibacterota bacterium]|nr:DUF192 domain-containing protein [Candidatus Paceibacterota bacterium]
MLKKNIIIAVVVAGVLFTLGALMLHRAPVALSPEVDSPALLSPEVDSPTVSEKISIKIGEKILLVDLKNTPSSRAQGLSGRESLSPDEGMLFVFETPGRYPFWMKDMNFSIDIIWLDENLNIVHIKEGATPLSYPATFVSETDGKYVLETVSGFSRKNNIEVGDKLEFLP